MAQAEVGLADEALASCKRLEEAVRSWPRNEEDPSAGRWVDWLTWRAEGARSLALAVQENHRAALDSFQAAYAVFLADDEVTTREMVDLVASLVARGVPSQDLLNVLASDPVRSAGLHPLIVRAARVLLTVIDRDPEAVVRALAERGGQVAPNPSRPRKTANRTVGNDPVGKTLPHLIRKTLT